MKYRHRYREGRCQDCGHDRNVTQVRFWVNDYAMILCADCKRQYQSVLLKPGNLSDPHWTRVVSK